MQTTASLKQAVKLRQKFIATLHFAAELNLRLARGSGVTAYPTALLASGKRVIYTGRRKVLCAGLVVAFVLIPRDLTGHAGSRGGLSDIGIEISAVQPRVAIASADDPLLIWVVKNGLRGITSLVGHLPVRVHAQIRPLVTAGIRN